MFVLMVQGCGYYGISAKIVSDGIAQKLINENKDNEDFHQGEDGSTQWLIRGDDRTENLNVIVVPINVKLNEFGFNTGLLKEGFDLIHKMMEGDLTYKEAMRVRR